MSPIRRRATLLAALGSLATLAVAGPAQATVAPPIVDGNTLTVNSDEAGDTITLAIAAGKYTVNGTPTTLDVSANSTLTVNGNGGADTLDATALANGTYGTLTANGGAGDDLLTGGAGTDTLNGDAGDDRLVGFRGVDSAVGGEGDDLMIWNNGDATDRNDGGNGVDEVEINGAPTAGDVFTVRQSLDEAGRVILARTNLVTFNVNFVGERLTVNGLGGDDLLEPDDPATVAIGALTSLAANGNSGSDTIIGADGADRINGGGNVDAVLGGGGPDLVNGGDANDTVQGDAGDDRLIGDRGADAHLASAGDDVIVWNNGDGSDPTNEGGEGFDRVEVNGSPAAGDVFTLESDGAASTFERLNLVPFTLGIANDNEVVEVNGGGGNDAFTVLPGVGSPTVVADGGAGSDELVGSSETDSFFGGSGNDAIAPGQGADLADGDEGDDSLLTRDGNGDLVRGGAGTDSAVTDALTVDVVDGVEQLNATAPPAPADVSALVPALGDVEVDRRKRALVAQVPLTCPAAEAGGCATTVTIATAKKVRIGKNRAVLVLGSKRVTLDAGERATVAIKLSGAAAELARRDRLATRFTLASTDAAGNSAASSTKVGLLIPSG